MIFKIQRPLFTNDPEPKVKIYDETREFEGEVPLTPHLFQFFEDELKVYVEGHIDEEGVLTIIHKVEEQDW